MQQITWSEWSRRVHWPQAVGACFVSWLGHKLVVQLILILSQGWTSLSLPAAGQTLVLLPLLLMLLLGLALAVGRLLGVTIASEERRQATVIAFGMLGGLYSFFCVSQHPLVIAWTLVNVLVALIGAGLAHRVQWLKIPAAMSRLFESPRR
ncbi:hypothetical protein JST97_28245 [bacterium]|nr:hypothetical protein [bacterium]